MPSPFMAALANAESILDENIGESVRIVPMVKTDWAVEPDADRPAFEVAALVTETDPSGADVGGMEARIRYEEWELEIRRDLLTGKRIEADDEVVLIERDREPRFLLSRIDDTDVHRLRLTLARKGS